MCTIRARLFFLLMLRLWQEYFYNPVSDSGYDTCVFIVLFMSDRDKPFLNEKYVFQV